MNDILKLGLAQIVPVWMKRGATLAKILDAVSEAADKGCHLVVAGGEATIPGYTFWLELTGGAVFNSPIQKEFFAEYTKQAVCIERGDLNPLCDLARQKGIAVYVGIIERPLGRGGHSLYCSLVFINPAGEIGSVHRKLMPTYEERLAWSIGDGNGLRTHSLGAFTVGGLNCWENWMPLARTALYAQGEDLHIAVWPGSLRNTHDITRMIAKESRSFVASVSNLMKKEDFPTDTLHLDKILAGAPDVLADGGTCLAGPDGEWIIEPIVGEEKLVVAETDHALVRRERQNFDPAGHYSRPDVLKLTVSRERQSVFEIEDGS
jgi:nitrilase